MGFRDEVRDAVETGLVAFAAANPTLVDRVYRMRPESLADTKAVFMNTTPMTATHTSGVRAKTVEFEVVGSVHLADNEETTDKVEALADALEDWVSANPHLVNGYTVFEWVRSTPLELPLEGGTALVPAIAITCRVSIQEGRI